MFREIVRYIFLVLIGLIIGFAIAMAFVQLLQHAHAIFPQGGAGWIGSSGFLI